jgi:hypothetical protein
VSQKSAVVAASRTRVKTPRGRFDRMDKVTVISPAMMLMRWI